MGAALLWGWRYFEAGVILRGRYFEGALLGRRRYLGVALFGWRRYLGAALFGGRRYFEDAVKRVGVDKAIKIYTKSFNPIKISFMIKM